MKDISNNFAIFLTLDDVIKDSIIDGVKNLIYTWNWLLDIVFLKDAFDQLSETVLK